jgi:hypothetical protein
MTLNLLEKKKAFNKNHVDPKNTGENNRIEDSR